MKSSTHGFKIYTGGLGGGDGKGKRFSVSLGNGVPADIWSKGMIVGSRCLQKPGYYAGRTLMMSYEWPR